MGSASGKGIAREDFYMQYVNGMYFVTTTLSTCGYGDISASSGTIDRVNAGVMTVQMFIGILFYSYTI